MKTTSIILLTVLALGCDFGPVGVQNNPLNVLQESAAVSESIRGRVVGVSDGDTIDVFTTNRETIRIRLNGIDCPERGQPFGSNAKRFTSDACFGRDVEVDVVDIDRYGRSIGTVFIDGRSLCVDLVAAGLAWHYKSYSDDETLAAAETLARNERRGLWNDRRNVAPWEWRKLTKDERDKLR